jgi:hypothetical protein
MAAPFIRQPVPYRSRISLRIHSHDWRLADEQQTSYAGTIEPPCVKVPFFLGRQRCGSRGGIKAQSRRLISQATAME